MEELAEQEAKQAEQEVMENELKEAKDHRAKKDKWSKRKGRIHQHKHQYYQRRGPENTQSPSECRVTWGPILTRLFTGDRYYSVSYRSARGTVYHNCGISGSS